MNNPPEFEALIDDCCVGERVDIPDSLPHASDFAGKKVVFTGFTTIQKNAMRVVSDRCGMIQQTGVCKSTDILICGDNAGPSKLQKARAQGVEIMTACDFFERLGVDCPTWALGKNEDPEEAERKIYINFFQQLPIDLLRKIYNIVTSDGENKDI